MGTINDDIHVNGTLSATTVTPSSGSITNTHIASGAGIERTKFAVETMTYGIPLTDMRKSAAQKDDLPDAPDSTELGLTDAAGPIVGTVTNGSATLSASEACQVLFVLPAEYSAANTITVRVRAKVSVARTVSAKVDVVAKVLADGALGSDICATAAQDLTTSYANYDFTITPTSRAAGDQLNIVVTLATDDTGGSSDGYPAIAAVKVLCGCKG